MNLRFFFTTALLTIAGTQLASAQDKIFLKNGGVIEAKVKEVSPGEIKYKKKDNPEGPNYSIKKREVERITYANGTKDEMDEAEDDDNDDDRRRLVHRGPDRGSRRFGLSNENYGKNLISLAPIQMANEGPAGFGIHYERVLDKRFQMSVVLPVAVIFHRDYDSYTSNYKDRTYTYIYPGFKFYPTGSNRRLSYALGLNAALGFGEKYRRNYYVPGPGPGAPVEVNANKGGLLISNSLNAQPTKHFYLGLELGLGFSYFDNFYDDNNNYYGSGLNSDGPLVQFSFKMGYRF